MGAMIGYQLRYRGVIVSGPYDTREGAYRAAAEVEADYGRKLVTGRRGYQATPTEYPGNAIGDRLRQAAQERDGVAR